MHSLAAPGRWAVVGIAPISQMWKRKLGGETTPGIVATAGRTGVSALPLAYDNPLRRQEPKPPPEKRQKEAEAIRPQVDQPLSPYLKAAAASPRRPSAPGWRLLWAQELVRQPGRARDMGWHQPTGLGPVA